jgi:hypothetical protein
MSEIIIVCVSDDLPQAEGLAEMFDSAGHSIRDDVFNDLSLARAAAGVLVISRQALACERFRDAAQRVLDAGKGVVACLEPAGRMPLGDAPVFDLCAWYGEPKDPVLDPLLFTVERMGSAAARARETRALNEPRVMRVVEEHAQA